ncbi:MAG: hypothetical protein Q8P41_31915 [Pseudomonadota bacterium]|nr:hypothetical protein [Pseudomonadota bacterium]
MTTSALPIDLAAYIEAAAGSLMVEKRFALVSEDATFVFLQENAAEIGARAVARMERFVSRACRDSAFGDALSRAAASAIVSA